MVLASAISLTHECSIKRAITCAGCGTFNCGLPAVGCAFGYYEDWDADDAVQCGFTKCVDVFTKDGLLNLCKTCRTGKMMKRSGHWKGTQMHLAKIWNYANLKYFCFDHTFTFNFFIIHFLPLLELFEFVEFQEAQIKNKAYGRSLNACCEKEGVPRNCTGLCDGRAYPRGKTFAECGQYFALIKGCSER